MALRRNKKDKTVVNNEAENTLQNQEIKPILELQPKENEKETKVAEQPKISSLSDFLY